MMTEAGPTRSKRNSLWLVPTIAGIGLLLVAVDSLAATPEHGSYFAWLTGLLEDGTTVRIDEATDCTSRQLEKCIVVVVDGTDQETISAERYRDGGTTLIKSVDAEGKQHDTYVPSPAPGGTPTYDGKPIHVDKEKYPWWAGESK